MYWLIDDEAALRRHVSMGLMQQNREYHKDKFKSLDGVLRIKEWPILTLFEA